MSDTTDSSITTKNTELQEKQEREKQLQDEIADKRQLIITRSRMLQIAQDRNMYKQKIIYLLFAIICILFIFTLMSYVYFSRKKSLGN